MVMSSLCPQYFDAVFYKKQENFKRLDEPLWFCIETKNRSPMKSYRAFLCILVDRRSTDNGTYINAIMKEQIESAALNAIFDIEINAWYFHNDIYKWFTNEKNYCLWYEDAGYGHHSKVC